MNSEREVYYLGKEGLIKSENEVEIIKRVNTVKMTIKQFCLL